MNIKQVWFSDGGMAGDKTEYALCSDGLVYCRDLTFNGNRPPSEWKLSGGYDIKPFNFTAYFNLVSPCGTWPSDNLNDAFNDYECKLCGHPISEQTAGSYALGSEPNWFDGDKQMRSHILESHYEVIT